MKNFISIFIVVLFFAVPSWSEYFTIEMNDMEFQAEQRIDIKRLIEEHFHYYDLRRDNLAEFEIFIKSMDGNAEMSFLVNRHPQVYLRVNGHNEYWDSTLENSFYRIFFRNYNITPYSYWELAFTAPVKIRRVKFYTRPQYYPPDVRIEVRRCKKVGNFFDSEYEVKGRIYTRERVESAGIYIPGYMLDDIDIRPLYNNSQMSFEEDFKNYQGRPTSIRVYTAAYGEFVEKPFFCTPY